MVRRRDAFERDPAAFAQRWADDEARLRRRIVAARKRLPGVAVSDAQLERAARVCMAIGTDGLRGELTLMRAARACASLEGDTQVSDAHLRRVAPIVLTHRMRRDPLDDSGSGARVARALVEVFG